MVIDTSAFVAILRREPERRAFIEAIEAGDARLMSVATFVETSIVIEARHGAEDCATWITSSPGQASNLYQSTRNTASWRAAHSAASERDGIAQA
jgi:uncharacterized protein with PIN domain